jgi:hypothetical protein
MHAWLLVGLLAGALAADPSPPPEPWKARLTIGLRAAQLDSPQPLGLSLFSDALLELRVFDHVALQVGSWPFVVPTPASVPATSIDGYCGSPAPATLRAGVSEVGDFWELGAMAGLTFNTSSAFLCSEHQYLLLMPFFRIGRDRDWGVDGGAGFFYTTLKEAWLGGHAPLGPLRAYLEARLSFFGWGEATVGVEVPGALVRLPRALTLRLEAGVAAVGWAVTPPWQLGPQGGLGMSWTW